MIVAASCLEHINFEILIKVLLPHLILDIDKSSPPFRVHDLMNTKAMRNIHSTHIRVLPLPFIANCVSNFESKVGLPPKTCIFTFRTAHFYITTILPCELPIINIHSQSPFDLYCSRPLFQVKQSAWHQRTSAKQPRRFSHRKPRASRLVSLYRLFLVSCSSYHIIHDDNLCLEIPKLFRYSIFLTVFFFFRFPGPNLVAEHGIFLIATYIQVYWITG